VTAFLAEWYRAHFVLVLILYAVGMLGGAVVADIGIRIHSGAGRILEGTGTAMACSATVMMITMAVLGGMGLI